MKINSRRTLTGLIVLGSALLLPSLCQADGPSGPFSIHVTGVSNTVWDVSAVLPGIDVFATNNNTQVSVECPIDPLNQNGIGKISGAGSSTVTLTVNDDSGENTQTFTGDYTLKGTITGGRGIARGTLMEAVSGIADIEGLRKVRASHTIKFTIDSVAGTLTSSETEHASAAGKGSISNHDSETQPLSDIFPGDGSWTLDMTLATTNKTVSGTATVTLNSGRVFNYTVKGNFNTTTGQSKLGLKGIDNAKGSTLQVLMDADVVTLIKGKISGQAVSIANP